MDWVRLRSVRTSAIRYVTLSSTLLTVGGIVYAPELTTHRSAVSAPAICAAGTKVHESSYNAFSDTTCALLGTGDQQSVVDFRFGDLQDNGGAVPTLAPALLSPLVDKIPADRLRIVQVERKSST